MRYGIVKGDKVLVDTSIWIEYFRNQNKLVCETVDRILSFSHIFVPKVVIAELIQGANSEKEISVIEDFVDAFYIIDQSDDTWMKAGRLSFSMKKKGITIHIIDCYIAVIANENSCKIFSLDDHFKTIKKFMNLELIA